MLRDGRKEGCRLFSGTASADHPKDLCPDPVLLGKRIGKDANNSNATFVTILGPEGARKEIWEHYCRAMEVLADIPRNRAFLRQLLNYIVNREQ